MKETYERGKRDDDTDNSSVALVGEEDRRCLVKFGTKNLIGVFDFYVNKTYTKRTIYKL